jgi:hypothetical protein
VEDVPDEEPEVRGSVLEEGADAILLLNEECQDTLKRGQVDLPVPKRPETRPKRTKLQEQNIKGATLNDIKSERATKGSSAHSSIRMLRDRPIPQQPFEWYYNPRMPREWNEMVSDMRKDEVARHPQIENIFRIADPEEISKPHRFRHLYRTQEWVDRTRIAAVASSVLGRDESDDRIRAMRAKYEKPCNETSWIEVKEKTPQQQLDKNKGKECALTEEDFPQLRQQWHDKFADIVNRTCSQLPPWREVNHEIHLIDDNMWYKYITPHCPNSLHEELHAKINRYVGAGWWEPRSVKQAAPLLCIPKKDGKLRTVVDAWQRNDNTVKDVTPLPDQEVIREDVA